MRPPTTIHYNTTVRDALYASRLINKMQKHNENIKSNKYYHDISIDTLLQDKENREKYRSQLIKKYKKPLLTFSLNIPYDQKNDNLINFNFNLITSKILFSLSDIIIFFDIKYHDSGDILYLVFDGNPSHIKTLFTDLEENTSIGRLLDIDIYDTANKKLSRDTLRKCFICDKPAFDCARNHTHAECEINQYIHDTLYHNFKDTLSCTMANSLYDELYTTPKPGLVDLYNCGSHKDLDVPLLQKSIKTISRYFEDVIEATYLFIIQYGYDDIKKISDDDLYDKLFTKLQMIGIIIEKNMFLSTGNVNTHKGAIYLSILILASFTIEVFSKEKKTCTHCLLEKISDNIKNLVKENYNISKNNSIVHPTTYGDYVYKKYKTFGPREEAYGGIPHIIKALDYLYYLLNNTNIDNKNNIIINNELNENTIYSNNNKNNININNIFLEYYYPITLLYVISIIKDTNLIHRGGTKALDFVKKECKKILKTQHGKCFDKNIIDKIYTLDKKFIDKNLSPGGSADILSMTIFLSKIAPLYIYDSHH